ncbi:hypothetical protein D3C76_1628960 [compost metagenome]
MIGRIRKKKIWNGSRPNAMPTAIPTSIPATSPHNIGTKIHRKPWISTWRFMLIMLPTMMQQI